MTGEMPAGALPARDRFCSVRARTEALAAPLSAEDQAVQSMPDCSPTKWHRAHTTWFFEEFVLGPHAGQSPHHPAYSFLWNSYYEAVGPRQPRPHRGMITRPSAEEVGRYRAAVDERLAPLLEEGGLPPEALDLVELGCHHEEQHQELLLMDAKHLLFQNPLRPAYTSLAAAPDGGCGAGVAADAGWVKHPGGIVEVGHEGEGFAYDNEGPRHEVLLQPFSLAERLVTEGEWLAFIDDGGYQRADLWLSDGWYAVQGERWEAPLYWEREGGDPNGEWQVFTLGGPRPVEPSAPVRHVSHYEADAFARWAGHRLPTEQEWEAVSPPSAAGSAGEAWEWTASAYLAYPGFRPAAGAVGEYNGKFMSGQHVLRGGSCATPPGHTRPTYRNFFPPAARWAFTGVRLAA